MGRRFSRARGWPLVLAASLILSLSACRKEHRAHGSSAARTGAQTADESRSHVRPGAPDLDQAEALEDKIDSLRRAGRYHEAAPLAKTVVEIRTAAEGKDNWETRDAARYVRTLERAASLPPADQARLAEADVGAAQVYKLIERGAFEAALPLIRRQLALRKRLEGRENQETLEWMDRLALVLRWQGGLAEAETLIREALAIRRRSLEPDHPDTLNSLNALGWLLHARGKLAEAEAPYREALRSLRRTLGEEDPLTLETMDNFALLLTDRGKSDEAEPLLRRVLEARRRRLGGNASETVSTINSLAYVLAHQGKLPEAETLFRKTWSSFRRVLGDDHPETLVALNNLAKVLADQGRMSEAEPLYRRALEARRRVLGETHRDTLTSMNHLAFVLKTQGQTVDAERLLRRVVALRRRAAGEQDPDTLIALNNLAVLLEVQGQLPEAQRLHRRVLETRRRVLGEEHPHTLVSLSHLALLRAKQGALAEAEVMMRRVLAIRRRTLGAQGLETLSAMGHLAWLLREQGKLKSAESLYREVLDARRRILGASHPSTLQSEIGLAGLLQRKGDWIAAEQAWREAAATFQLNRLRISASGLERVAFATERSPLPDLAACLIRNGKPLQAWERLESNLARGLLDALSARYGRPLKTTERTREQNLLGQLAKLDEGISAVAGGTRNPEETRTRLEDLRRRRESVLAEYIELQKALEERYGPAAGGTYPLERIQKHLSPDAALLAWLDIEDGPREARGFGGHWACVVRDQGRPVWVALPGSGAGGVWTKDDGALPRRTREGLSDGEYRDSGGSAERRALYRQRIAPIEPQLAGVHHLIVLPAGSMAAVPVEALLAEAPGGGPASGCTVSYTPSGTMYAWLAERAGATNRARRSSSSDSVLALGDPVFSPDEEPARNGFTPREPSPLPGTRREVRAIERLFRRTEARVTTLLGPDASEQKLDELAQADGLRAFRYLHFATHAVMDDRMAMRSALLVSRYPWRDPFEAVLAGREVYDGRLTADQIVRTWRINADLVTLSGCETGLGAAAGGEGFLGFAQALFTAGAKGLCLSLWPVDDTTTMLLMTRFYENLLGCYEESRGVAPRVFAPGSAMPKAEALREAKRWLRSLTAREAKARLGVSQRTAGAGTPEAHAARRGVDIGQTVRETTRSVLEAPYPFRDPYHWAAFILIGGPM